MTQKNQLLHHFWKKQTEALNGITSQPTFLEKSTPGQMKITRPDGVVDVSKQTEALNGITSQPTYFIQEE